MRVLSGIQPTGTLHLGNYFGAVRSWADLQHTHETIVMIADLHALTTQKNPHDLEKNSFQMFVDLMAAGIDPERSILFIQSHVKEHAELAWIVSTITPLGELYRMTQFKDKSKKEGQSSINAGLLTYPILQTADIFLYETDLVPIGKDQEQHLELSRAIARKFNHIYGETFKEPKALVPKQGAKVMSVSDPSKKMSKSLGANHYIGLFDPPDSIRKKIKTAVTDTGKEIRYDTRAKPGISNLLTIFSLVTGKPIPLLEKEWRGKGYAEFKSAVAEAIVRFTDPFRARQTELLNEKKAVRTHIKNGALRAQKIASRTMGKVRKNAGLLAL